MASQIKAQVKRFSGMLQKGKKELQIPLKRVDVKSKIVDFITKVDITQTYANTSDENVEVDFIFPLEHNASLTSFCAHVGGKVLVGVSKSIDDSAVDYSPVLFGNDKAFIFQQTRPGVFLVSLDSFPGNSECTISIGYISELSTEGDKMKFILPTPVAPKYLPTETPSTPLAHKEDPQYCFTLEVCVEMATDLVSVTSPTHNNIEVKNLSGKKAQVLLKSRNELNRDLYLLIETRDATTPRVWMEHSTKYCINTEDRRFYQNFIDYLESSEENKGSYVAALSYFTGSTYEATDMKTEKEIVFLVDVSASMQGGKLHATKLGIMKALDEMLSIKMNLFFNIFSFSDRINSCFPEGSVPVNKENVAKATECVNSLVASSGTEMLSAIHAILDQPLTRERDVIFLTDGEIWNLEDIITYVSKHPSTRIFTIGIGHNVSHNFINGLSRASKGTAEFVIPGTSVETILQKIERQLKRALSKRIDIVDVKYGNQTPVVVTPSYLPCIYENLLFMSFALLREPIKGNIAISFSDGTSVEVKNENIQIATDNFLHQMFARKRILDLSELELEGTEDVDIKKGITDLAIKYNVLSKYTTFVVVDKAHDGSYPSKEVAVRQNVRSPVELRLEGTAQGHVDSQPTRESDMLFIEVTEMSLGVGTLVDGITISENEVDNIRMINIVDRHTAIPTHRSIELRAKLKEKSEIMLRFFEGQRVFCGDNFTFKQNGLLLPGLPKNRELKIMASIHIDAFGKPHARADVSDADNDTLIFRTQPLYLEKQWPSIDHELVRRMEIEADAKYDDDIKKLSAMRNASYQNQE
jgi:Ca-activated chloride channel family protein